MGVELLELADESWAGKFALLQLSRCLQGRMGGLDFCRAAVAMLRLCWLALGPEQPLLTEVGAQQCVLAELRDGAAELGMEWDLLCHFGTC